MAKSTLRALLKGGGIAVGFRYFLRILQKLMYAKSGLTGDPQVAANRLFGLNA
jgi:hypothetical protein